MVAVSVDKIVKVLLLQYGFAVLQLALLFAQKRMVIIALTLPRHSRHARSETHSKIWVQPVVDPLAKRIGKDLFQQLVLHVTRTESVAMRQIKTLAVQLQR